VPSDLDVSAIVLAAAAPTEDLEPLLRELRDSLGHLDARAEVLLVANRPDANLAEIARGPFMTFKV
jgi:hypothetical protein